VASTYRPGPQRISRPSAMGDYKRQRPQVAQSYGREERNRSISGQDQSVSTRGSQDGHSPVVESDGRGRFIHSHQSLAHPGDRRSPRRERYNRPSQNDSDSDAGSDDDSEIASSRSGESSRSSSFSDNESTRKSVHKLDVVDGSGAEGM